MQALESIARRAACALAGAALILIGAGTHVATSSKTGPVDRVAIAQHGARLEFAFGEIELAVAPDWTVSYDESVVLDCPHPHSAVLVTFTSPSPGNAPRPECGGGPGTTTVLSWYPALARLGGAPFKMVDGIAVQGPVRRGRWSEFSVPAEHYVFYVQGPQASAVLSTLSRSARATLAHLTPAPAVPRSWKPVVADGLRFAVPSGWPVEHRSEQFGCLSGGPLWDQPGAAVIYGGGEPSPAGCSGFGSLSGTAVGLYGDFWGDGAVVSYPALAPLGPSALWGIAPPSHACARVHGLTVCPAAGDNTLYGPALFTVKRPGSQRVVSLTVGLEGDGSVARTVIGSLAPA